MRARLRLLHLVDPVLHRVVLFALVAALDVLQVAHPISRKHRVKELHRPVPPGRVLAALKAVDVELSDEGAKVVVLEVQREHVLRRAGEGSARCVLPVAASGRRGPRRCARACANLVRSTILNDSPCSLQHTRLSDAGDETISKSFIRKGATCSGARAAVGRMCGCVSRAAARGAGRRRGEWVCKGSSPRRRERADNALSSSRWSTIFRGGESPPECGAAR